MNTKAKNKTTGDIVNVIYAANSRGNMRMWVDGKFYTDKQFDKTFKIISQEATQSEPMRLAAK